MIAAMVKMTQVSESPGAPPPQAELVSPNQTWWSGNKANPSKPGCDGGDRLAIQNQTKPNLERITYNIVTLGTPLQLSNCKPHFLRH